MKRGGRLAGRVAIVTGAAQGIGARYAHALAREGAAVAVADMLGTEAVAKAIVEMGGNALAIMADLTDPESVRGMVPATVDYFGKLDILVNNAPLFGGFPAKSSGQSGAEDWDRMMAVNVRGVFECVKAAVPAMRKQKYGKIVNIASATAFGGAPMMLHYVASKGAIVAMSRSLARELGGDGIRVNTLAPGLGVNENVLGDSAWKGAAARREAAPDDLCGTLVYLCSSDSDFVTGQVLAVDGGLVRAEMACP